MPLNGPSTLYTLLSSPARSAGDWAILCGEWDLKGKPSALTKVELKGNEGFYCKERQPAHIPVSSLTIQLQSFRRIYEINTCGNNTQLNT